MPTFYYDYYKIENYLREFEQKFDLTRLGHNYLPLHGSGSNMKTATTEISEGRNYIKDPKILRELHEEILEPATKLASEQKLTSVLEWGEYVEQFSRLNPKIENILVTANYKEDKLDEFNFAFENNPSKITSGSSLIANSNLKLDPNYYSIDSIKRRLSKSPNNTQDVESMGNILAQEFKSDKSQVDLNKLEQETNRITTGGTEVDGFDVLRVGVQSGIVLTKLIDSLKNHFDKDTENQKTLTEIDAASKKIDALTKNLSLGNRTKQDKQEAEIDKVLVNTENLSESQTDNLINQAISYIEQETKHLLKKSEVDASSSITNSLEKESADDEHNQKRLKAVNHNLDKIEERLDNSSNSKNNSHSEYIYQQFLNHFRAIDELQKRQPQTSYEVKGKVFEKVKLSTQSGSENIEIAKDNKTLYAAARRDGKWTEHLNNLDSHDFKIVNKLSQTPAEVAKDYSAQYLAKHLSARRKSFESIEEFDWKYIDEKGASSYYHFAISPTSESGRVQITGTDNSNSTVFEAEIDRDGSIDIVKNNIPVAQIDQFRRWQKSQTNQADNRQLAKPHKSLERKLK